MSCIRGQSGVEYLTMYAIAFMILLVVIAGVYYMMDPGRTITPHCDFPVDLFCSDFYIKENGSLTLMIRQTSGHPITIGEFNCTTRDNPLGLTRPITPVLIDNGAQKIVVDGTPCYKATGEIAKGTAGNFYTGNLYVKYNETDTGFTHVLVGRIVAKYE